MLQVISLLLYCPKRLLSQTTFTTELLGEFDDEGIIIVVKSKVNIRFLSDAYLCAQTFYASSLEKNFEC